MNQKPYLLRGYVGILVMFFIEYFTKHVVKHYLMKGTDYGEITVSSPNFEGEHVTRKIRIILLVTCYGSTKCHDNQLRCDPLSLFLH